MSVFEAINPHRKLADSQLADSQLADSQLADSQLADSQLADSQLADSQLADSQLADSQLADSQYSRPLYIWTFGFPLHFEGLRILFYANYNLLSAEQNPEIGSTIYKWSRGLAVCSPLGIVTKKVPEYIIYFM